MSGKTSLEKKDTSNGQERSAEEIIDRMMQGFERLGKKIERDPANDKLRKIAALAVAHYLDTLADFGVERLEYVMAKDREKVSQAFNQRDRELWRELAQMLREPHAGYSKMAMAASWEALVERESRFGLTNGSRAYQILVFSLGESIFGYGI